MELYCEFLNRMSMEIFAMLEKMMDALITLNVQLSMMYMEIC